MSNLLLDRAPFEHAYEFAPPVSDAEFLYNAGIVAESIGVEPTHRDEALKYLADVAERELPSGHDKLHSAALDLASRYKIQESKLVQATTFLLSRLVRFDEELAQEGVEVAELSLAFADRLDEITGVTTDRAVVWSGALGHDNGKSALDPTLNQKSKEGKHWTLADIEAMKPHSLWGFIMAIAAGQPLKVARIEYANHAKQPGAQYGEDITLSADERRERDMVAAADGMLACMTRSNSRNEYLAESERWTRVFEGLLFRFNDYKYLSERNNPKSIAGEMLKVGQEYISQRYKLEQKQDGLVVVHQIGSRAVSLAAA